MHKEYVTIQHGMSPIAGYIRVKASSPEMAIQSIRIGARMSAEEVAPLRELADPEAAA